MDASTDREYSRPPVFEDVVTLCRALNKASVRYILIGGFAVVLHGSLRGTKDIDLLVDASEKNVGALKRAMAYLPDNAVALIQNGEVKQYGVVRIADEFVVDLMRAACGIDYEAAMAAGIQYKEIEGVRIPIPTKALLIRMKDTIRFSDKSDIQFLQVLIEEEERGKKGEGPR